MIGKMRRRVTIEQKLSAADGGGGASESWVPIDTVWAWMHPVGQAEPVQGEQKRSLRTFEITMRYRSDVTPAHRLVFGQTVLAILSVIDREDARRWLVLTCEEGGAS